MALPSGACRACSVRQALLQLSGLLPPPARSRPQAVDHALGAPLGAHPHCVTLTAPDLLVAPRHSCRQRLFFWESRVWMPRARGRERSQILPRQLEAVCGVERGRRFRCLRSRPALTYGGEVYHWGYVCSTLQIEHGDGPRVKGEQPDGQEARGRISGASSWRASPPPDTYVSGGQRRARLRRCSRRSDLARYIYNIDIYYKYKHHNDVTHKRPTSSSIQGYSTQASERGAAHGTCPHMPCLTNWSLPAPSVCGLISQCAHLYICFQRRS